MSCYFMVDTYIDEEKGRGQYDCFGSEAYRQIMKKRMDSVDARAVVVEGMENPAKDKSVHDIPGSENRLFKQDRDYNGHGSCW